MALTPAKSPDPEKGKKQKDDVFVREVDDAVRRSDMEAFGRRYGIALLLLVLLGLAAFAGYIVWDNQQDAKSGEVAEKFITGIDAAQTKDAKEANATFDEVADAGSKGYRGSALMMKANLALEQGKTKEAVKAYAAVAADDSLPAPFRDLALVRQTAVEFETLAPKAVVARMKPLAQPGNPWFGSAGELTALAYMKMGREDLAGTLFAEISRDAGVPLTLRSRTRQMAGVLGVDAVQDEDIFDPSRSRNPAVKAAKGADK